MTKLLKGFDPKDVVLLSCKSSQMKYGFGIPERAWSANFGLKRRTFMIID